MANTKSGSYAVETKLVCDDHSCVLQTRVVTGPYRGTAFSSPVPTPGQTAEEATAETITQKHRSTALLYLTTKVFDGDDGTLAAIDGFAETMSWDSYFTGRSVLDRGKLYDDFLKWRRARNV